MTTADARANRVMVRQGPLLLLVVGLSVWIAGFALVVGMVATLALGHDPTPVIFAWLIVTGLNAALGIAVRIRRWRRARARRARRQVNAAAA
jgi:hypothetical protein